LIDGFPRATDQAIYFEQNVSECQNVIFYDVSAETLMERVQVRALTSGRTDDNAETMIKRFAAYNEQSKPVVELYERFGKVKTIYAHGTVQ
jgi:UMP-CMP kinase